MELVVELTELLDRSVGADIFRAKVCGDRGGFGEEGSRIGLDCADFGRNPGN